MLSFDAFQRSFAFDRRLLPYEIAVDSVWAIALEKIGILTDAELKETLAALVKISKRAQTDAAWPRIVRCDSEDVHHFVEKALVEELGRSAGNCTPGAAATNSSLRIFVCSSSMQPHASKMLFRAAEFISSASERKSRLADGRHDAHAARVRACIGVWPSRDVPRERFGMREQEMRKQDRLACCMCVMPAIGKPRFSFACRRNELSSAERAFWRVRLHR